MQTKDTDINKKYQRIKEHFIYAGDLKFDTGSSFCSPMTMSGALSLLRDVEDNPYIFLDIDKDEVFTRD